MTIKVGINGFGRIGRNFFRAAKERGADIDFVAANDLLSVELMAHLLKYDSILGPWDADIEVVGEGIKVNGDTLQILSERDPKALPWKDLEVDLVVESSGLFTDRDKAAMHLEAGAPLVIVSAPAKNADATFVVGVNDDTFDREQHKIISNASCTTNCFVPMVKILDDAFGVDRGLMTTVHAYTGTQALVDGPSEDLREARAAAINVIPASTGAARATGLVLQAMQGRLDGQALRVPVPDGSITDFTAILAREASVAEINEAFRSASEQGHRQPGQGARLVRQRVGIFKPADRSDRASRSPEVSAGRLRTISDLGELVGRRVLVRCDFNVPLDDDRITDDLRIRATIPTIDRLSGLGANLVLCSHLGRPKGRVVPELRLDPVAARLAEILGREVTKLDDVVGPAVEETVHSLIPGSMVLLENLRFHPGEEANDAAFAEALASLAHAYVDDAFGAAHRSHASVVGVAGHLPAGAGLLMQREVEVLSKLRDDPEKP